MASFSTRLRTKDNQIQDPHDDKGLFDKPGSKFSMLKDLLFHQSRMESLTRSLIRIIGLIVIAGIIVAIYEWIN